MTGDERGTDEQQVEVPDGELEASLEKNKA